MSNEVCRVRKVDEVGDAGKWDSFLLTSNAPCLIFRRSYMTYHADRFPDESLIVENSAGDIAALMPAIVLGGAFSSHGALTFGGLVTRAGLDMQEFCNIYQSVVNHVQGRGYTSLFVKGIPSYYLAAHCDFDEHFLRLAEARLAKVETSFVIDMAQEPEFSSRRKRGIKKALKEGLSVREANNLQPFWSVLAANLEEKHGARPVHSLEEMILLKSRFPENIRAWEVVHGDSVLGGCIMYESKGVAHSQYISASPEGRDGGALDLLFAQLIREVYRNFRYFSFGTANEGQQINFGLARWKQEFGARGYAHRQYQLDFQAQT